MGHLCAVDLSVCFSSHQVVTHAQPASIASIGWRWFFDAAFLCFSNFDAGSLGPWVHGFSQWAFFHLLNPSGQMILLGCCSGRSGWEHFILDLCPVGGKAYVYPGSRLPVACSANVPSSCPATSICSPVSNFCCQSKTIFWHSWKLITHGLLQHHRWAVGTLPMGQISGATYG